ncbi:hypothetical protein RUND412_004793 [Rhizina undulata]
MIAEDETVGANNCLRSLMRPQPLYFHSYLLLSSKWPPAVTSTYDAPAITSAAAEAVVATTTTAAATAVSSATTEPATSRLRSSPPTTCIDGIVLNMAPPILRITKPWLSLRLLMPPIVS